MLIRLRHHWPRTCTIDRAVDCPSTGSTPSTTSLRQAQDKQGPVDRKKPAGPSAPEVCEDYAVPDSKSYRLQYINTPPHQHITPWPIPTFPYKPRTPLLPRTRTHYHINTLTLPATQTHPLHQPQHSNTSTPHRIRLLISPKKPLVCRRFNINTLTH